MRHASLREQRIREVNPPPNTQKVKKTITGEGMPSKP